MNFQNQARLGIALILASNVALADLAYVSIKDGNPHIYLVSARGVETRLTQGDAGNHQPAWSPDGSRMAFASTREGLLKVFTMNADGSAQVRVTSDDRIESSPSWSPDGHSLAFFSADPAGQLSELVILDLRAGSRVAIRGNGRSKGPTAATWSADGQRLAFNGDNDKASPQVWVVERDGSNAREIGLAFNSRRKGYASISPDGRSVAYVADSRPGIDLIITDLETGQSRNLTASGRAVNYEAPTWSPDGKRLAFASSRDDPQLLRMDIFVMEADGSGMRNLSAHPHEDYHPRWTSDGRSVYFTSLRTGTAQLYSVDLGSGQTRQAVSSTSHDMDPAPRPKGLSFRSAVARMLLGQ